jgi:hypothetical protein
MTRGRTGERMSRTLEDRARSRLVREWAQGQGLPVSDSGRIAQSVWDAARGAGVLDSPPPDDTGGDGQDQGDGPDWDAAAGELGGGGELGGLEDELTAEAAAAAGPPPPAPAPEAPADLDAARERVRGAESSGRPKLPKWASSTGRARPESRRPAPVKITKTVSDDITGKLALLLSVPAATWEAVDPYCGGALADNLDPVVRAAVPLICLSQEAVRWFQKTSTFMLVVELALALRPVAEAAWHHHIAGDVLVLDDGRVIQGKRGPDGRVYFPPIKDAGPATAGAAAGPDYSAYTTQPAGHIPPVHANAG